jgi:hypothetical protein
MVIRPVESDCALFANIVQEVVEGDLSVEPLRFTCAWKPQLFAAAPWNWRDSSHCFSVDNVNYFVNNFSNGQITLHLHNICMIMNQESFEGQVTFNLVSGQTLLDSSQPASVYAIERKQKHKQSSYQLSFRPTSSSSRSGFRNALVHIDVLSPPKVSHCVLLKWKTSVDSWDLPAGSLLQQIESRYRSIKEANLMQPQQEILCFACEPTELLLAAVSVDEETNQVYLPNPNDYNMTFQLQKGRGVAVSHDVNIVTVDSAKLLSVKFSAPQSAAGSEYFCNLALSSRKARGSDYNISIRPCTVVIAPPNGFLKFETDPCAMQLLPNVTKESVFDIANLRISLKTHSSVQNSSFADSELRLCAYGTTALNSLGVELSAPSSVFKLRNSRFDSKVLKFSIGPIPPLTPKIRVNVFVPDVDQTTGVRRCCMELFVPSVPGQSRLVSSLQHSAAFADEAKRLTQQCTELRETISAEEAKKEKYKLLKHLEQSIKTVDFEMGDEYSSLRHKVAMIPGCYVAGDTAKVLLPVFYLERTIHDSIEQLPQSSKHLLQPPSDTELKHAGAVLAWKISELLQPDTFSTVIIDAKWCSKSLPPSQIHQAEQEAIFRLASESGQMSVRYLPLCSIERSDENRRELYDRAPLVPAEEHFVTGHAKSFDRCQFKNLPCDTVLDRPVGFLDWAVNFLHLDPKFTALKFRQKFWLPLLQNVVVFDRSKHAEDYKKYREHPGIGLPPITILTVFDDYFFHHDSSSGISSYRRAPNPASEEIYRREWGMRVAPAVDRLSFISREISSIDSILESHRKRLNDSIVQLRVLDPSASLGWAIEPCTPHRSDHIGRAARKEVGNTQPIKRVKFGESPGGIE